MKNQILFFILSWTIFFGCQRKQVSEQIIQKPQTGIKTPKQRSIQIIDSLENQIHARLKNNPGAPADLNLAMYAAKTYQEYAIDFRQDPLSPVYLMKSASVIQSALNDPARAAEIYGEIHNKYPDFEQRSLALFLKANALHDAGDSAAAITELRLFLLRYPDDTLANQARQFIVFIKKPWFY